MIQKKIQIKSIEFLNTHIAGFAHYDGVRCFDKLKIGDELTMVLEPNNHYDHHAIALYKDDMKLGYIPRSENNCIWAFLRMDHADLFEVFINRISPDNHPEQQVHVSVRIVKNNESTTIYDPGDGYDQYGYEGDTGLIAD